MTLVEILEKKLEVINKRNAEMEFTEEELSQWKRWKTGLCCRKRNCL